MGKRQRDRKNSASLLVGLITKAIYVFVTIGLISFVCNLVLPEDSLETLSGYFVDSEDSSESETQITVIRPSSLPVPTIPPTPTYTPTPTISVINTPTSTNTPVPTCTPTPSYIPTPTPTPIFSGVSYLVIDYTTDNIILSKNPEQRIFPASTIKLLTAMVALDHASPDITIELTKEALADINYDVTNSGVPAGTTYTLEVWLHLLLIRSFGDAANAIAEGCAGSMEQFIVLMNKKITELGLVNTTVDNAIGLDVGNGFTNIYSTAEDMLAIAEAALSYPLIREIIAKTSYIVPATGNIGSFSIKNTNPFLGDSNIYFSDYFTTIGGKTGTTKAAGNCLVTLVTGIDGHEYLCVYFGGVNRDTMSKEIIGLLEYAIQVNMDSQN